MSYIFQKEVENTEECTPLEPVIEYSIELLPSQVNQAKSLLAGSDAMWSMEQEGTLHFKNKRRLLRAGTMLVLKGIKIVKTKGI